MYLSPSNRPMFTMPDQSFIYNFLLAPRFRKWRYISIFSFFILTTFNHASLSYREIYPILGNKVFLIILVNILAYIILFYCSIRIFIPKFLLTGKYILVFVCIFVNALIFQTIPNTVFTLYLNNYNPLSQDAIIDTISSFVVYLLCISGAIITIFLRNWITSHQHLNLMKKKQKSSQIEQLKEQINPSSFFKILNKSRSLVKPEPDKASDMLIKLSQLLRYQLYDCNRNEVLLTAEISFLRNFLELERLHTPAFCYTIDTADNINATFISPSILLPYVQSVVNTLNIADPHPINIYINNSDNAVNISIKTQGVNDIVLLKTGLRSVEKRLDTLYKDHFILNIINDKPSNETRLTLILEKI